ncbi:MAG: type II toxin-antitoxin system HicA family toxin [Chloroflexota bacterium]
MSRLPQISGWECVKALQRAGFVIDRQRGSHFILIQREPWKRVSVPNHKTLKIGTLRGIISQSGLTVEEFLDLLA